MTIDDAIQAVQMRKLDIEGRISALEQELAGLAGEQRGLEHARDLFSGTEGRQDIKGPVMRLFADGTVWTEEEIVETVNRLPREADIPAASIRKFLFRAVRDGKLALKDGIYSLPVIEKEAAE